MKRLNGRVRNSRKARKTAGISGNKPSDQEWDWKDFKSDFDDYY